MIAKHMIKTALVLSLFAFVGTGLVSVTQWQTRDQIRASETQALLRSLHAVLDPSLYNNTLLTDTIMVNSREWLGSHKPTPVYRARKDGSPVALILSPVAPDGYNGDIHLLVGVLNNGHISGVRVLNHRETPGLGDAIEARRSDWILAFTNKFLQDDNTKAWQVKRDGGVIDQFTGATITPRAIVQAVKKTLQYVALNKEKLFTA
ncbi:MAG: electron transport complex subunit RsxG, partial [Thiohalomonadales bacterium]